MQIVQERAGGRTSARRPRGPDPTKSTGTLPDPVDTVRDAQLLAHYGLTRGQLVDQIGGSP